MTQAQFIAEVYAVAWASNPDLDDASSFQEILKELQSLKDKALRMDILISSFKPEPELFPTRPTLKETQARRQGEL
tara:strand:+ start:37 stop:264 length:228 start_codon:yes stop_codon:yes gene_type:complete